MGWQLPGQTSHERRAWIEQMATLDYTKNSHQNRVKAAVMSCHNAVAVVRSATTMASVGGMVACHVRRLQSAHFFRCLVLFTLLAGTAGPAMAQNCAENFSELDGKCVPQSSCTLPSARAPIVVDTASGQAAVATPPIVPGTAALLAGAGISDITGPAAEALMLGYASIDQATAGMHTRLFARAFVFADATSGKRVVFVSAELGRLFSSLKQGVLKRLTQRYGNLYDDSNVQIAATHTHAGPGGYAHHTLYNLTTLGFSQQNYDVIVEGITRAIIPGTRASGASDTAYE